MSDSKKQKYDMNSPEAKALIDGIVHGTFVKEGTMVAFPPCFPGVTVPIPADEGRITALDVTDDGIVYGGTSGHAAHVFVAMFHGVTGMVFDRGTIEGTNHCAAVCCGKTKFAACLNGPDGGRVVTGALEPLPFDLIQEWGLERKPLQEAGKTNGQHILHAVPDSSRATLVGITPSHLFTVDIEAGKMQIAGEVPGSGRITVGPKGGVFGQDGPGHLWRYDIASRKIQRQAVKLPDGAWDKVSITWARDRHSGLLYTADGNGTIFALDEERGFSPPQGRTLLVPVGPMAVTHDGRLFGFCGAEMARMFCCHPDRREVSDLGVAASTIERRRYGYAFGDAVTGRDGEIIFGEDDNLGHVWLYFPRIQARTP